MEFLQERVMGPCRISTSNSTNFLPFSIKSYHRKAKLFSMEKQTKEAARRVAVHDDKISPNYMILNKLIFRVKKILTALLCELYSFALQAFVGYTWVVVLIIFQI